MGDILEVCERVRALKTKAQELLNIGGSNAVDALAAELLALDDEALAAADIGAARTIQEIACILLPTKRFDLIERLFAKAIHVLRGHPRRSVADLFLPLHNLTVLYDQKGDHQARAQVSSQILVMAQQLVVPVDEATANCFAGLARLYALQGDPKAAAVLYRHVHGHVMRATSFDAHARALLTAAYGNSLIADGQVDAALSMFERSLAVLTKQSGFADDTHLQLLALMANAAEAKGDLGREEDILTHARDVAEHSDLRESGIARVVCHNLAALYVRRGRREFYGEAERLMARNAAITEQAGGTASADYAGTLGQLANVVAARGDLERAASLFRDSFLAYERATDTDPAEFADFLSDAGLLYLRLTRAGEAVATFQRARELRAKIPGLDASVMANTLSDLATACFEAQDLPQAIRFYREAIEVRHRTPAFLAAA